MSGMQEFTQNEKDDISKKVEKLAKNNFKQLSIPAWRPTNTIMSTMLIFGFFSVLFLGIGVLLYHSSDGIFELTMRYDDKDKCYSQYPNSTKFPLDCTIDFFQIDDNKPNITSAPKDQDFFVYYELTRFYQNQRRFYKSRILK